jgi:type IV pilus assembly protein PilN
MRISLNLATRPYIELRPVYARLRVVTLVLILLALPMLLVLRVEQVKAQAATARVDQLHRDIALLEQQQQIAHSLMQQPTNAEVLERADFLNQLFRRKAFSWTATISDLENTLPGGVQVLSIDPIVAPDGHVTIRLRVSGPRDRGVELVRNLEHSRHFVAPHLASEALANQNVNAPAGSSAARAVDASAPAGNPNDVAFDILADYRPLPNSHDRAGAAAGAPTTLAAEPPGTAVLEAPAPVMGVAPTPQHRAQTAAGAPLGTGAAVFSAPSSTRSTARGAGR